MFKKFLCPLTAGLLCLTMAPLTARAAAAEFKITDLGDGNASVVCVSDNVKNVEIPAELDGYTITALGEDCFADNTVLETVTIPDTITSIGSNAFEGCTALTTVTIPANVTTLGSFLFEGCTALTEIQVADENTAYMDDAGVLYTKDGAILLRYPAAKPDGLYRIPDTCTTIDAWAFTECSGLQTLEMSGVTAIGADAFFCAASLQNVVLSDGITELIDATFAYCVNLRKITLPTTLETIGNKCFYGCVSLLGAELPEGLESIGEMAFYGCMQMKELTIPSSVKVIGEMGVGYSVDPETNENTVIEGFKMKTVSGSRAQNYAKRNDIPYDAEATVMTYLVPILIVAIVVIVIVAIVLVYLNRQKAQKAAAEAEAAKREAKREARRQRRNKSGN